MASQTQVSNAIGYAIHRSRSHGAVSNAIGYASHYSRSHDAVIRVYDEAGNVVETNEHAGEFKEP